MERDRTGAMRIGRQDFRRSRVSSGKQGGYGRIHTERLQPVHTIRNGSISASIWRQDTEKGPMFNVTFQRSYKEGEEWKKSTSFGRNNLLLLSLLAMRAFEWITSQPRQ